MDQNTELVIEKAEKSRNKGMDENKSKALSAALSQIEKQFGKGSIMRLGEADIAKDIPVVSTGSLGLDIALGVGKISGGVLPAAKLH